MVKVIYWIVGILIAAGLAAIYYFQIHSPSHRGEPAVRQPASAETTPDQQLAPPVRHPIPEAPGASAAEKLPSLNDSDAPVREALTTAMGPGPIERFLIPDNVIRRFVTSIDNLPRQKLAVQLRPLKSIDGTTLVSGSEDAGEPLTLSPDNAARYATFIDAVRVADVKQLTAVYFRYYPLFQRQYEDLGYPGRYFNDRMVEAIDHLLETPRIDGPIQLARPKVFYEFADPTLESRSAGQKLLIRMGAENAAVVKQKLRELRAEITASRPAE